MLTLPRLAALTRRWKELPPAAVQLARIASVIGVKTSTPENRRGDFLQQARAAGIPLIEGKKPDDPDLGFLDDHIGLGQGLQDTSGRERLREIYARINHEQRPPTP